MFEKKISGALFEYEMTKTSSIFGRDSDIRVVFEGKEAKTKGDTIVYPTINQGRMLSQREVDIGRGFVNHEAGHIRHTERPVFYGVLERCDRTDNGFFKSVVNGLEDCRIERKVTNEYLGSKKGLSTISEAVNQKFKKMFSEHPDELKDKTKITGPALTWEARNRMRYATPSGSDCLDMLEKGYREKVEGWTDDLWQCENTRDVIELAKKICKDIDPSKENQDQLDENFPMDNLPESSDPESNGNASDGEISNPKSGETKNTSESARKAQPKGGNSTKGSKCGEGNDGDPMRGGVGAGGEHDFDITSAVNEELEKTQEIDRKFKPSESYRPVTTKYDTMQTYKNPSSGKMAKAMNDLGSVEEYHKLLGETSGSINVVRRKLERALEAKKRQDWDRGRMEGKLDTRRLVPAVQGAENVYKVKEEAKLLDTAVTILVDQSGSMSGTPIKVANQVTVALLECFSKLGIPFEILGFTNYWPSGSSEGIRQIERDNPKIRYHRRDPLHMPVYKTFDESIRNCKVPVSAMQYIAPGNNSDAEAVLKAYNRLKKRQEARKIMIVLSDGYPAVGGCSSAQQYYLRHAVDLIQKDGCDVMGVGICSDAVSNFYPKYAVCNNIKDLPKTTIDMISKALLGGRSFQTDPKNLLKNVY
jgi:cobalamin biosynthesis protein CobT